MSIVRVRRATVAAGDGIAVVDDVLEAARNEFVHYSVPYLRFLAGALPHAEVSVLIGERDGRPRGLLPLAITRGALGSVVNSLPFFGSHGGPIVVDDAEDADLRLALLRAFGGVCDDEAVAAATLVENPSRPLTAQMLPGFDVVDDRLGQVTRLPAGDVEAALMARFHEKTRNAIRKGQSAGVVVSRDESDDAYAWLQRIHEDSIGGMGGIPKSLATFEVLRKAFSESIRLYTGCIDGVRVAGLLVLLYRRTVEYFTPVVAPESRASQVLSAVIFEVMRATAVEGYALWNWGGTWRSQEGVYRFKKRFGADEFVYRYFNQVRDSSLRERARGDLTSSFPNFYVLRY